MPAPMKARSCATRSGFQVSLVDGEVMRKTASHAMPRPVLGRRQGEGRRATGRLAGPYGEPIGARRRAWGRDHRATSRCLSGYQPDVFNPDPALGAAFKLVERKPSPRLKVT